MKIADEILKNMYDKELRKVLNLIEYKEISDSMHEMCEGLERIKICDDYSLIHKIYLTTFNIVSFWAEVLSGLPVFDEYCDIAEDAIDKYSPGTAFSPITMSYFGCWAYYDVKFGKHKETMASCMLDLKKSLKIDNIASNIINKFQNSYMGVYKQTAKGKNYVCLEELFTKKTHRCLVASEYTGDIGEIWFARVLPSPLDSSGDSLVFTTPYILSIPSPEAWLEFIDRNIFNSNAKTKAESYIQFMKQGLSNNYWHNYIDSAYVTNSYYAIHLKGIPDMPETMTGLLNRRR